MTREEIINEIKPILEELSSGVDAVSYLTQNDKKWLEETIKVLEQEPCDDAISRQYLLDNCVVDKVTMPYVPINKIENAPSVTQKSGKWLYKRITGNYRVTGQCSECKKRRIIDNFCPNCGCRMVEPQESEE